MQLIFYHQTQPRVAGTLVMKSCKRHTWAERITRDCWKRLAEVYWLCLFIPILSCFRKSNILEQILQMVRKIIKMAIKTKGKYDRANIYIRHIHSCSLNRISNTCFLAEDHPIPQNCPLKFLVKNWTILWRGET